MMYWVLFTGLEKYIKSCVGVQIYWSPPERNWSPPTTPDSGVLSNSGNHLGRPVYLNPNRPKLTFRDQ